MFPETETPEKFLMFQETELSYIFRKLYSEPWYIQNLRHIQNTIKHLRWNLLALILTYFLYFLKTKFFLYFGKQFLIFLESELSFISRGNLRNLKNKRWLLIWFAYHPFQITKFRIFMMFLESFYWLGFKSTSTLSF